MDSDGESSLVVINVDNPAGSDDDDHGVLALPSSCSVSDSDVLALPSSCSVSDSDDRVVLVLSSFCSVSDSDDRVVVALPSSCSVSDCDHDDPLSDDYEEDVDDEDMYEVEEENDTPRLPPPSPLSGMFYPAPPKETPAYAAFYAVRGVNQLIPDPDFSAFPEKVTVLASTRGLVFLRGDKTGFYYVTNPFTFKRVRLPYQNRDHRAYGAPSFVVTFDETRAVDTMDNYRVVVAFQVFDGVYAFESFSSRTWKWCVGAEICAVETVVPESGVGALGLAFWRTTIGYILCYDPETDRADLIAAPQEVETQKLWEIGEMEGNFCVVCMDEGFSEVAVLYFVPDHLAGEPSWACAGQFDVGSTRNRTGARLLRSQSATEVVMWCPQEELVLAMDFDGRVTRTIGPFCGFNYFSDFVPYVSSFADICRNQVDAVFKTNDEAVTYKVPNSPLQAYRCQLNCTK